MSYEETMSYVKATFCAQRLLKAIELDYIGRIEYKEKQAFN